MFYRIPLLSCTAFLVGAVMVLGMPVSASAQSDDVTFAMSPSCPDQDKKDNDIFGEVLYTSQMIVLGDGRCQSYDTESPTMYRTPTLSKGDTLDFDVVVINPSRKDIHSVRAWLSYDPTVLEGKDIELGDAFPNITPGEQDFDIAEAVVKLGLSADEGESVDEKTIRVARVSFEVIDTPADGSIISFYDIQTSGHTTIEDTGGSSLLSIDPSSLHVLLANLGGGSCTTDADCTDGTCSGGICQASAGAPNGMSCVLDAQCSSNSCVNGICGAIDKLPFGSACGANTECLGGLCIDFLCRGTLPSGSSCTDNNECESGLCDNGQCTDKKAAGSSCGDNTECLGGLCIDFLCKGTLPNGSSCTESNECDSGLCLDGSCTAKKPNGSSCTDSNECEGGLCRDNQCSSLLPVGSACEDNSECLFGICLEFLCKDPSDSSTDSNAAGGALFDDGSACTVDEQCKSNNCEGNICSSEDNPLDELLSDGESCIDSSECMSGVCTDGTCAGSNLAAAGASCTDDSSCMSNNCEQGICLPEGTKSNGESCIGSNECLSGSCENFVCTDGSNSPSLSTAFGLLQPQNLRVTTQGASAFLTWDALASSNLKGYNIYYGTTSGRYIQRKTVGPGETSITLRSLPEGTRYFFAIRAISTTDEESAFSQEVSVIIGDPASSSAPFSFSGDTSFTNPVEGSITVPGETGPVSTVALLLLLSAGIGTFVAARRQRIAFTKPTA